MEVLNVEKKIKFWKYLELLDIEVTLPNLESLGIKHESVMDFQMRFFMELGYLLFTDKVFIVRKETSYIYIFRISNYYALNNLSKIKPVGDFVLNNFPFKYISKKRKVFTETKELSKKIKLLNLDEDII